MTHKHYMMVSKVIFTVVAIMHLLRALFGWTVVFNGHVVPIWYSWVAFLVAGYLAYSAERFSK